MAEEFPDARADPQYDDLLGTWEEDLDDASTPVAEPPRDVLSVTHDLNDRELRRFAGFDVFHDPMPVLGFIPQWLIVMVVAGLAGALGGFVLSRDKMAALVTAGLAPVATLVLLELQVASRRRLAREQGLCGGRIVSISPLGLSVRIAGAQRDHTIALVGPMTLRWRSVRKITKNRRDLIFWMRPSAYDPEGRARLIVPLRAFNDAAQAAAFEAAARRWSSEGSASNRMAGRG